MLNNVKKHKCSFTIIEILIVLAILAIVILIGTPITLDFYLSFIFHSSIDDLVSLTRKAQSLSITNFNQASSGIYITPDKFIVFQGASYASRNQQFDEEYSKPPKITISGTNEIIFSPISGRPNANATITLSSYNRSANIYINKEGSIEW